MIMQQEDGMSNLAASVGEAPLLSKCSSFNKPATIRKRKLDIAKEVVGHPFSKELFPKCVNLKTAKVSELKDVFGKWPLEAGDVPSHRESHNSKWAGTIAGRKPPVGYLLVLPTAALTGAPLRTCP